MTVWVALAGAAAHMPSAAPPVAAVLVAGSTDPTAALQTYGPLGLMVALMLLGWLVPKYVYDRLVAENEQLKELTKSLAPMVEKNSEVTAEAIALIRLIREQLDEPRSKRTKP